MTEPLLSILFDLDGTIVDSRPGIAASCEAALRALGHQPDGVDLDNLIGPPLEEVLTTVLGRFGDDRVAEAVLAYREHYGAAGFLESAVYPGLVAALDGLAPLSVVLYVATSKRRIFAEKILAHVGLIDRFAGVYGSEPGGAIDHKADLIAHVLRQHEIQPARCLMIGDRRHDAEGAHTNGVTTVGVLWGYGERQELVVAGVRHIASQPADLVRIVEHHLGTGSQMS